MTIRLSPDAELDFRSVAFPGGTLLASIYDRTFMQLSDRGGASNAVGDRWAEICDDALGDAGAAAVPLRTGEGEVIADQVVRLDDIPEIARIASRHHLQNPDFLMVLDGGQDQVLWAADAKFSVDTARSKQVSAEVVEALLGLGDTVRKLLPTLDPEITITNGVFLVPDYALTHRILRDRRGPRRATVKAHEVRYVPVTPDQFLDPLGQKGIQGFLAGLDDLPMDPSRSLMLALYYYRLARAAVGCWQDQSSPLLAYRDTPVIHDDAVEAMARSMATIRTSAWGLVLRWNDVAEEVRRQRAAVDHVTSLPINNKELREQIAVAAHKAGKEPPSISKVRKALGSWFRSGIREHFGPIYPPVDDFGKLLDDLGKYSRSMQPEVKVKTESVIAELVGLAEPASA